jgi:hypothetical protein
MVIAGNQTTQRQPGERNSRQPHRGTARPKGKTMPAGWKGEESLKESLKCSAEGYWTLCRSSAGVVQECSCARR